MLDQQQGRVMPQTTMAALAIDLEALPFPAALIIALFPHKH